MDPIFTAFYQLFGHFASVAIRIDFSRGVAFSASHLLLESTKPPTKNDVLTMVVLCYINHSVHSSQTFVMG